MTTLKFTFPGNGKREIHCFRMEDEPSPLEPRQLRSVGLQTLLGRLAAAVGFWMAWQSHAMFAPDPAPD